MLIQSNESWCKGMWRWGNTIVKVKLKYSWNNCNIINVIVVWFNGSLFYQSLFISLRNEYFSQDKKMLK